MTNLKLKISTITSVSFQIVSDIHIERDYPYVPDFRQIIKKSSDNLILAGDIGRLEYTDQYFEFLKSLSFEFKNLYLIPGNNEFYSKKYDYSYLSMILLQFENSIANLKVLDNKYIDIENTNIRIFGSTLWSYIPENKRQLHLPIKIDDKSASPTWMNRQHFQSLYILENTIENLPVNKELIVVTHYAPTFKGCISEKYKTNDALNCYYHSNLERFFHEKINTWIFGHTHTNCDYINGNVRIMSNQYSCTKGEKVYEKDKIIKIKQNEKIFVCRQ